LRVAERPPPDPASFMLGVVTNAMNLVAERENARVSSIPLPDPASFVQDAVTSTMNLVTTPRLAPGPTPLPVVGNTIELLAESSKFHTQLLSYARDEYKDEPFVELWLGDARVLVVNDADVAQEMLNGRNNLDDNGRPSTAAAHFFDEVDSGFVNTKGETWRMYRTMANKTVSRKAALVKLAATIADKTDGLAENWQALCGTGGEAVVRIDQTSKAVTLESIVAAVFSSDLKLVRGDTEAVRLVRSLINLMAASDEVQSDPLLSFRYLETDARLRKEKANAELDQFIVKCIDKRVDMAANGQPLPGDMLDSLMGATDADGKPLRLKAITNTLTELLVAGHDTTAALVACTMMLLAYYPDWQRRVVAELETKLPGDQNAPRTIEEAESLTLLTSVLKETLRLYPGVLIALRTTGESGSTLGGTTLPPGTSLWTSPYVLGRLPQYWGKDAETFDPSRFEGGVGDENVAYLPFGGGKRYCVGANMAMLEAQIVVAGLLRRFEVSCTPELSEKLRSTASHHLPVYYGAGLMAFDSETSFLKIRQRQRK